MHFHVHKINHLLFLIPLKIDWKLATMQHHAAAKQVSLMSFKILQLRQPYTIDHAHLLTERPFWRKLKLKFKQKYSEIIIKNLWQHTKNI